jgi:3-oxoacyl-[acyl-carrier protein] reductase
VDLGLGGKVAVVAASSKGLGKASALALAGEGARVTICARSEQELAAAAKEIRWSASVASMSWSTTPVVRRRGSSRASPMMIGATASRSSP